MNSYPIPAANSLWFSASHLISLYMVFPWSNKDNNTSLPHRGVVGVLGLYRALRMQSTMCQVLLFCSHPNQCCAGFHDIVIFKSQIPWHIWHLQTLTTLLTTYHKLTTRENTDSGQYSKRGPPGYLVYLYNIFIFDMIFGFTESVKLVQDTTLVFCKIFLYYCTLFAAHWLVLISWELFKGATGYNQFKVILIIGFNFFFFSISVKRNWWYGFGCLWKFDLMLQKSVFCYVLHDLQMIVSGDRCGYLFV